MCSCLLAMLTNRLCHCVSNLRVKLRLCFKQSRMFLTELWHEALALDCYFIITAVLWWIPEEFQFPRSPAQIRANLLWSGWTEWLVPGIKQNGYLVKCNSLSLSWITLIRVLGTPGKSVIVLSCTAVGTTAPALPRFQLAAAMTWLSSLCHLPCQSVRALLCWRHKQRQREEEFVKIKVQIMGEKPV